MIDDIDDQFAGEPDERKDKSSGPILGALKKAEREFDAWQATCHGIDEIYGLHGSAYGGTATIEPGWRDSKLDLFWSSFEVLKPAVYAKPPVPAVAPLFKDNRRLKTVTAELLERCSISTFRRINIDDSMCETRDDLLFAGRGVLWLTYETDGGQKVDVEHLDRTDFRHEPARKWSEVGWVARRAWLTKKEARKRFRKHSGDAYQNAKYLLRRDDEHNEENQTLTRKAGFWEVWHKADKKVYWVSEGVDVLLDSGEPHLSLSGFWPCPRPAYGTLRRRSLVPVPDWERYAIHFRKISTLTGRIYCLLDQVKLMGIISGGGDISDAVEEAIRSDDDQIVIRVPSMVGINEALAWLPLKDVAEAIQGLILARQQLIDDFYQLSGISDIMRGATEAEETLGAQQLKSQYGSVRVRCKIDELQRIAAEAVKIAAEIIADKFSKETLLEMSQMEIPTKADVEKRIKEIESAAKKELEALTKQAQEAAQQAQEPVDRAQAKQMLQQAQQQILAKYAPMLEEAQQQVPIEEVISLLRDDKARSFAFEIETDSTILTDEMQEKTSRNEFVQAFTSASQGLMQMAAMGEQGAKLAGEMMKFTLAPYRAGRQLDGAIDAFIDAAPQMAQAAQAQSGEGDDLAEANKALAEAEMVKAKAAMAGVEAKAALDKAEMQRKVAQMQMDGQAQQQKAQEAQTKLEIQLADMQEKARMAAEKQQAEIDHLTAQTAKILASIGLDERKQQLSEYTAAEQSQTKRVDQAMQAEGMAQDAQFRAGDQQRAERGEERADRQQEFSEQSTDRQMTLAERQALAERSDRG